MTRRSDKDGTIYCLVNAAMPGIVKVGVTRCSVESRIKSLFTTGLPIPSTCFCAKRVADPFVAERLILGAFSR